MCLTFIKRLFRVYRDGIFTTEAQSPPRDCSRSYPYMMFSATSAPPRCNLRVLGQRELQQRRPGHPHRILMAPQKSRSFALLRLTNRDPDETPSNCHSEPQAKNLLFPASSIKFHSAGHFLSGQFDRLQNLGVACAAAEIPRQGLANLVARRPRVFIQ
jgi:hypothetical protein